MTPSYTQKLLCGLCLILLRVRIAENQNAPAPKGLQRNLGPCRDNLIRDMNKTWVMYATGAYVPVPISKQPVLNPVDLQIDSLYCELYHDQINHLKEQ